MSRQSLRRMATIAVLVSVMGAMTILGATSVGAEPTVDVTVGVSGFYAPDAPVPVVATVTADRLVEGTLEVFYPTDHGVPSRAEIPVSLAGGTTKTYRVTVPMPRWNSGEVIVELTENGEVLASSSHRLREPLDADLVAVLPDLAAQSPPPQQADLTADLGVARFSPLPLDVLAEGPAGLAIFDAIIGSAADLRALSNTDGRAVASWVADGGILLIDDDRALSASERFDPGETAGRWLPESWRPRGAASQPAGRGEVRLTGGQALRGAWDGLVPPTRTRGGQEEQMLAEMTAGGWFGSISRSIATSVEVNSVSLRSVVGFLALYIFVVGPVTFIVLHRTGRELLGWLVVPCLAIVATGFAIAVRSQIQPGATNGHATELRVTPGAVNATSFALIGSSGGGDVGIDVPMGWSSVHPVDGELGPRAIARTGARVSTTVPPGGYVVLGATGPVPEHARALEVSAGIDAEGNIEVIVTNTSDRPIEAIAAISAGGGNEIGRLEPGASATTTIADADRLGGFGRRDEARWWPGLNEAFGPHGPIRTDSPVSAGLWTEANQRSGANFRRLGHVLVIGWDQSRPSPLSAGAFERGTTMHFYEVAVEPGGDRLTGLEVSRTLVRGPASGFGAFGDGERLVDGSGAFRFEIPPDVGGRPMDESTLVAQLADVSAADVWVDGSWVALRTNPEQPGVVRLPAGSVQRGSVVVRFGFSMERLFEGRAGRNLLIREASEGEFVADPPAPVDGEGKS